MFLVHVEFDVVIVFRDVVGGFVISAFSAGSGSSVTVEASLIEKQALAGQANHYRMFPTLSYENTPSTRSFPRGRASNSCGECC